MLKSHGSHERTGYNFLRLMSNNIILRSYYYFSELALYFLEENSPLTMSKLMLEKYKEF
jgi:hypothetical protein